MVVAMAMRMVMAIMIPMVMRMVIMMLMPVIVRRHIGCPLWLVWHRHHTPPNNVIGSPTTRAIVPCAPHWWCSQMRKTYKNICLGTFSSSGNIASTH
jgi:hypothetical protein